MQKVILPKISCWLTLAILISFISWYTIPPLVDFQAHLSLGMLDLQGPLSEYYQYHPGLTYRLFDTIIRFWTLIFGRHYASVALASYLSFLFILISTLYTFFLLIDVSYRKAFYLTTILLAPFFLLLHSLIFVWGFMPFILAVFMAIPSSIALWQTDTQLINAKQIDPKLLTIFSLYTFLSIYSHPAGFLFLGIACLPSIARLIVVKNNRVKRFYYCSIIFAILLILLGLTFFWGNILSTQNFPSHVLQEFTSLQFHFFHRMQYFLLGNCYDLSLLFITQADLGLFGTLFIKVLLSVIPFLIFYVLFFYHSKNSHFLHFLITIQLAFALIMFFVVPSHLGELVFLDHRYWQFVIGWTIMGMAYLLYQVSEKNFRILCLFSPFFISIVCYILMPLYANFRHVPIEKVAHHYTKSLLKTAQQYRLEHPETSNETLVISFLHPHPIGKAWYQYHLVPFIMLLSPELANQKIIVREHWFQAPHLSVGWRSGNLSEKLYFRWKSETKNDILLLPCQLNKANDCILNNNAH